MMNGLGSFVLMAVAGSAAVSSAADWIRPSETRRNASFVVEKTFRGGADPCRATLKASAAGIGVWYLNGKRIGRDFYEPVVTYYEKEIFYREYDVTGLLSEENVLTAEVGGGWWEQNLAWACERKTNPLGVGYGDPAVWGELTIERSDGTTTVIGTDTSWRAACGRSVWNNVYGGEIHDARGSVRPRGAVVPATDVTGTLKPATVEPCRELRRLAGRPTSLYGTSGDFWIYDFGTNIAGTVAFNLPPLVPGSRLKVRLSEALTTEGFLDVRSEGSWATHHAPEYVYIAPETPEAATWTPEFSYASFRYAEVSGYEPFPDRDWGACPPSNLVEAVMIATDVKTTGSFVCSHAPTAAVVEIADNTIRCNLHGLPEDCPGREKGGWLGDAQLVCAYALQKWDLHGLYAKFMDDIALGTELRGCIPFQVPTRRAFSWGEASPLWRAAAVEIPYRLYLSGGDAEVVRRHWPLIERCLEAFVREAGTNGIVTTGLGDWIPPVDRSLRMPVAHSSTLCWIDCARKAAFLADALGLPARTDYAAVARDVGARFVAACYDAEHDTYGHDGSDAAAWNLGVCPPGARDRLFDSLVRRLEREEHALTTGIYGSPALSRALIRGGRGDVFEKVFFNERRPSYLGVIRHGHTTMPEELRDRLSVGRGEPGTRSLSHPMHAGWLRVLVEDVAGIVPLKPGYAEFEVDPHAVPCYATFTARVPTPHGTISLEREAIGRYHIEVPEGTRCRYRPTGDLLEPGRHVR